jgi:hypothetical protein
MDCLPLLRQRPPGGFTVRTSPNPPADQPIRLPTVSVPERLGPSNSTSSGRMKFSATTGLGVGAGTGVRSETASARPAMSPSPVPVSGGEAGVSTPLGVPTPVGGPTYVGPAVVVGDVGASPLAESSIATAISAGRAASISSRLRAIAQVCSPLTPSKVRLCGPQ